MAKIVLKFKNSFVRAPTSVDAVDPEALYLLYPYGGSSIVLLRLLDDKVVATVAQGHSLIGGTSRDDMLAVIGQNPDSLIIFNDQHELGKMQLVELPRRPWAVDISAAQDTLAVILDNNGMQAAS